MSHRTGPRSLGGIVLICCITTALNLAAFSWLFGVRGVVAGPTSTSVAGDMNGDEVLNIEDPIYLLTHIFQAGPPPVACAGDNPFSDSEVAILQNLLEHVEVIDESTGSSVITTVRITGANLQVVNGLGATNGLEMDAENIDPLTIETNGMGNLIIGYNEDNDLNPDAAERGGSHNLVLGTDQSYQSFGGIVAGRANSIESAFSSVVGGEENTSLGVFASVLGGRSNAVSGGHAIVVGGGAEFTPGNDASANYSVILGGSANTATASASVVCGGQGNIASGEHAVAVGGQENGGVGEHSVAVGGNFNGAGGAWSVVGGGQSNNANGVYSSVSGGDERTASAEHDWAAGGAFEDF